MLHFVWLEKSLQIYLPTRLQSFELDKTVRLLFYPAQTHRTLEKPVTLLTQLSGKGSHYEGKSGNYTIYLQR